MKRVLALGGALALALAAFPAAAQSGVATTTKDAHLRAGPDRDYPLVAQLKRGVVVDVFGCIENYRWCDVTVAGYRGWVFGGNLNLSWQGSVVPLQSYGWSVGIPLIGFVVSDYWTNHYRDRRWYPDHSHFVGRSVPVPHPGYHPQPPRHEVRPPVDHRPPAPPRFDRDGQPEHIRPSRDHRTSGEQNYPRPGVTAPHPAAPPRDSARQDGRPPMHDGAAQTPHAQPGAGQRPPRQAAPQQQAAPTRPARPEGEHRSPPGGDRGSMINSSESRP